MKTLAYDAPKFEVEDHVKFEGKWYFVTGVEGQFDPGSVCWTYKLEGVGWVEEHRLLPSPTMTPIAEGQRRGKYELDF